MFLYPKASAYLRAVGKTNCFFLMEIKKKCLTINLFEIFFLFCEKVKVCICLVFIFNLSKSSGFSWGFSIVSRWAASSSGPLLAGHEDRNPKCRTGSILESYACGKISRLTFAELYNRIYNPSTQLFFDIIADAARLLPDGSRVEFIDVSRDRIIIGRRYFLENGRKKSSPHASLRETTSNNQTLG